MRSVLVCAVFAAAAATGAASGGGLELSRVWERAKLTFRRAISRTFKQRETKAFTSSIPSEQAGRLLQSAVPQLPGQCNFTYDSEDGFWAEDQFDQANVDCMSSFVQCMQTGSSTAYCQGYCSAQIDILESNCDTTFCAVSGTNPSPTTPNLPAFDFRSGACYPEDCGEDLHDAVIATWRYRVCGPALYTSADCAAIDMNCAYDISDNTVWIIVGSVVGFFVLLGVGFGTWYYCEKRRRAALGVDDDDDGTGEYVEGAEYDQGLMEHEQMALAGVLVTENNDYSHGDPLPPVIGAPPGITYADMSTRGTGSSGMRGGGGSSSSSNGKTATPRGNAQDAILSSGEDGL